MGRLTRDAEVSTSAGEKQTTFARFTIAVDRRYQKDSAEQSADFIRCVAFGSTAEFLQRYGMKGTKFVVEGRIQTGSYTNKDNQKVYTTDVVVENLEFAESKKQSQENGTYQTPQSSGDGFMNIPDGIDDEIPFT